MPSPDPSGPPGVVLAIVDSVPWRALLLDLLVVAAWIIAVSVAWRRLDLPAWLYYAVAFGGVVGYSLLDVPRPPLRRS